MTDTPVPNGSAEAPIELVLPSVVGINFGNSYASIAVLSKVSESMDCDRLPSTPKNTHRSHETEPRFMVLIIDLCRKDWPIV